MIQHILFLFVRHSIFTITQTVTQQIYVLQVTLREQMSRNFSDTLTGELLGFLPFYNFGSHVEEVT